MALQRSTRTKLPLQTCHVLKRTSALQLKGIFLAQDTEISGATTVFIKQVMCLLYNSISLALDFVLYMGYDSLFFPFLVQTTTAHHLLPLVEDGPPPEDAMT